jgi:hypothetical protein
MNDGLSTHSPDLTRANALAGVNLHKENVSCLETKRPLAII